MEFGRATGSSMRESLALCLEEQELFDAVLYGGQRTDRLMGETARSAADRVRAEREARRAGRG